ncbi:hypothetical protein HDG34_007660 [Paraburkholderia sp. HC6.4b]|uniref:hypothetical protein n=1 Tax=unclassified Paraburkholderia TaxID=2615204 RepID=UPI00160845AD|nr:MULTISPECIES: hypothetical protein [unclassified Paraburkholderia]MBB5413682.1 hypothetical protein [Paraburkholderia sp. HC6.4b]MBB5456087.1 hypothetical protein [Paraburkholderia sp. Kb1A]
MTKQDFVQRSLDIAKAMGLRVDAVTQGEARGLLRICFNEKSGKFLHELHLQSLYPLLRKRGLSVAELNAAIESVAPGRPCTHRGMREIIVQLQNASAR